MKENIAKELEIARNKIKTINDTKFKYKAAKAINEITTNYNQNCAVIVFRNEWPIIENKTHNDIVHILNRKYKTLNKQTR